MKQVILTALFVLGTIVCFGQKKQEITIQSSIQCEMCVNRLDNMFIDLWSVRSVRYNLEEQTIKVVYNSNKLTEEELKQHIADTGYDANEVKANLEAHNKLPKCCQKDAAECDMKEMKP